MTMDQKLDRIAEKAARLTDLLRQDRLEEQRGLATWNMARAGLMKELLAAVALLDQAERAYWGME